MHSRKVTNRLKTWGGKLPEISQKTYDAVMEGFDKLAKEAGLDTAN